MIVENLDVELQTYYKIFRIDYVLLHYVSLTSNVKRAHKRKEGTRLHDKRLYKNGLGGFSGKWRFTGAAEILIESTSCVDVVQSELE